MELKQYYLTSPTFTDGEVLSEFIALKLNTLMSWIIVELKSRRLQKCCDAPLL